MLGNRLTQGFAACLIRAAENFLSAFCGACATKKSNKQALQNPTFLRGRQ